MTPEQIPWQERAACRGIPRDESERAFGPAEEDMRAFADDYCLAVSRRGRMR